MLNFGHTVGHAVESISARQPYPLLHGECVSIGMLAMTDGEVRRRLTRLLHRYDLPTAFRCGRDDLCAVTAHDKEGGRGRHHNGARPGNRSVYPAKRKARTTSSVRAGR